jgi:nucleoside-diphosphate-sugar epimerase
LYSGRGNPHPCGTGNADRAHKSVGGEGSQLQNEYRVGRIQPLDSVYWLIMSKDLEQQLKPEWIIENQEVCLVTGSAGFIGNRVVERLIQSGFINIRCLVRTQESLLKLRSQLDRDTRAANVEIVQGNLLSRDDCARAIHGARIIFHLAAGRGEKSYPDAFLNSVVTTRNLIEAALAGGCLERFVNVSSFSVYANRKKIGSRSLDESCPVDTSPQLRGDAYTFAKVKQDELVKRYGERCGLNYVIVRPGHVYGPGNPGISGRVGIDTFGRFLHLGGSNIIPFTYVDNCAEAIVLAGLCPGVAGEVFNVVDDKPFSSRRFLRSYKKNVRDFGSIYVPHWMSYLLCWLWESFSVWSEGQLPLAFNRRRWHAMWKQTRYSNKRLKERLGWTPRISTEEGMRRHFEACRVRGSDA